MGTVIVNREVSEQERVATRTVITGFLKKGLKGPLQKQKVMSMFSLSMVQLHLKFLEDYLHKYHCLMKKLYYLNVDLLDSAATQKNHAVLSGGKTK